MAYKRRNRKFEAHLAAIADRKLAQRQRSNTTIAARIVLALFRLIRGH